MLNNPNTPESVYPTIQASYIIPPRSLTYLHPNFLLPLSRVSTPTHTVFVFFICPLFGPCLGKYFWILGKPQPANVNMASEPGGRETSAYRSRNYQLEMLEASMKENIIVAVWHTIHLNVILYG